MDSKNKPKAPKPKIKVAQEETDAPSKLLNDVVLGVIERSKDQDRILPSVVANAAYRKIDPYQISPTLVRIGCVQALKQIARGLLRRRFDGDLIDADEKQQHPLFPNLQTHYPISHNPDMEPTYCRLELLSPADFRWNVNHLTNEAESKLRHARALRQYAMDHNLWNEDEMEERPC